MSVIAFDAYEREGTGKLVYSEKYGAYAREKEVEGLAIILKADEGLVNKSKLTVQGIKWDENCFRGGCILGFAGIE